MNKKDYLAQDAPPRYIDCQSYDEICLRQAVRENKQLDCTSCKSYKPIPLEMNLPGIEACARLIRIMFLNEIQFSRWEMTHMKK